MTNGISHRALWYYGWNIVAVCILSQIAANAMAVNSFSLFLGDWSAQLHMPISSFQLGLGGGGLGCALIAPLVGACVDKYPSRVLFGVGLASMALFCFGISSVTQPWQFFTLYTLLMPIAISFSSATPANAVLSRWFVRRLGLALGLSGFGLAIAGIIMPPIIAAVMPGLGWRAVWRIAAVVIAAIILPIVLIVLREQPTARDGSAYLSKADMAQAASAHGHSAANALTWRGMLRRRNFWLLVIVYLPMMATYGGCSQNIAPLALSRGLSQHAAGVLISLLSLSQIAFTLGGGMLSDRIGNRLPLAGLAFCTALGGVSVAWGHSMPALALGIILAGAGGSFWPLLAAAVAAEFGPQGVGRAFGLLTFFLPVAVLAPFAVAKTQENTGSYGPALIAMSIVTVIGGAACLLMREPRRGQDTPSTPHVAEDAALPSR